MARTYAYVKMVGDSYMELGNDGVELEVYAHDETKIGKESKTGTLYVGRAGIKWMPRNGKHPRRLIPWSELDGL